MADERRSRAADGVPGSGEGCPQCWPADADDAWRARERLQRTTELIDDFHLHVMLLSCAACRQTFLSVFTEIIDWSDGEDPQSWMLAPISQTDAEVLRARGNQLSESELNTVGRGRRTLWHDAPKGGPATTTWIGGLMIGRHD